MRIPHIINKNTIQAYEVPSIYIRRERIKSDDFTWDVNFIKTLRELCLITIAENFETNPIYSKLTIPADKLQLLELISTDLPLELTVPIIEDDFYWERCFHARWPDAPEPNRELRYDKPLSLIKAEESKIHSVNLPSNSTIIKNYQSESEKEITVYNMEEPTLLSDVPSETIQKANSALLNKRILHIIIKKSWKQTFLQKFVEDEIERMKPDTFNPEYIIELVDLYGKYILCLHVKQLQASKKPDSSDHISLYTLLSTLPQIIEFRVCFNQANLGDNFTWHSSKVSKNDCELLGKGVEKSNTLKVLRVHRSNIDCEKVKLLIRPFCDHSTLNTLDLCHCKIGDEGAKAIAGMLTKNSKIEKLLLVNNLIGSEGARGFAYYLCHKDDGITELNLRLNPLGPEGGKFMATALTRGAKSLSYLNISACGLTVENIHLGLALALNTTLEQLDLSNNNLGEESADNFLYAMGKNSTLIHLDLRMCGFLPQSVQKIQEAVRKNLETSRQVLKSPPSVFSLL